MSIRGRGTLEIRESDNPFYQPTSGDIGLTADKVTDWKVTGRPAQNFATRHNVDGNFAFLYTRESDRIGSKVAKPQVSEVRMLSRTEFLKQRRERAFAESTARGEVIEETTNESFEQTTFKIDPEAYLRAYKHEPKYEDPRYLTSTAEFGKKAPSIATVVTERNARPQAFSKSFLNIKPKNSAMNTALTKSTVHKNLDPQFV